MDNSLEKKAPSVVLITSDEIESEILRSFLESSGYLVRTAGTAWEAIDFLNEEESDLLLTDLYVQGMPGEDLIRWVRENKKNVKPIVYSNAKDEQVVLKSLQAGAFDHISKTSSLDLLLAKIKVHLNKDFV